MKKKLEFLEELWNIVQGMEAEDMLLFLDETSVELNRRLSRIWWPRGDRPKILVDGGRSRLNIIGALDMTDALGFFAKIKTLDAVHFQLFLEKLLEMLPKRGKAYIVLDNAKAHHAKLLGDFLEKNEDRLQLVFLPPYSPDLNPIEIFWRVMKRDVSENVYHADKDALFDTLREYLYPFRKHPSERVSGLWNSKKYFASVVA